MTHRQFTVLVQRMRRSQDALRRTQSPSPALLEEVRLLERDVDREANRLISGERDLFDAEKGEAP